MGKSLIKARHIKHLEWAVLLSRTNLDECKPGDWLNIIDGLYDFIYWAREGLEVEKWRKPGGEIAHGRYKIRDGELIFPPIPKKTFLELVTKDVLINLRDSFRTQFESLTSDIPPSVDIWRASGFTIWIQVIKPSGTFVRFISPEVSKRKGDVLSVAQYTLGNHLVESGIAVDQIRTCPECQGLFLLNMRPRKDRNFYCSMRCSRNAATRAYRKRKKEQLKERERERSRRRYVKKQKKNYGPKVKVGTKPRKQEGLRQGGDKKLRRR